MKCPWKLFYLYFSVALQNVGILTSNFIVNSVKQRSDTEATYLGWMFRCPEVRHFSSWSEPQTCCRRSTDTFPIYVKTFNLLSIMDVAVEYYLENVIVTIDQLHAAAAASVIYSCFSIITDGHSALTLSDENSHVGQTRSTSALCLYLNWHMLTWESQRHTRHLDMIYRSMRVPRVLRVDFPSKLSSRSTPWNWCLQG